MIQLPPRLPDPVAPGRCAGWAPEARLREHPLAVCADDPTDPGGPAAGEADPYAGSFARLVGAARDLTAKVREEDSRARAWIEELRPFSPGQRLVRVANASTGFRGRVFELRLLSEARAAAGDGDPAAALGWAELAERAVVLSETTLPAGTWLLAEALRTAAHQRLGDEERVARLLEHLGAQLAASTDCLAPDELAELLLVLGRLHTERAETDRARELLARAVLLWYSLQQADRWLSSLLELARADLAAGDVEAARDAWHLAAVVHQAGRDPELRDLVRSLGDELRARGALPDPASPPGPEPSGGEGSS